MTPSERERDWSVRLLNEVRIILLKLEDDEYDGLFDTFAELYDEQVPHTEMTWEAKNMMASLVVTPIDLLMSRPALHYEAVQRLERIRDFIRKEAA